MIIKRLLLIGGFISFALAIIGIIFPIMPTTPFLLLAAAMFFKSSNRWYNWIINHKLFGVYIINYRENRAIPLHAKIIAISMIFISIAYAVIFVVDNIYFRILLIIIAISVSFYLIRFKTLTKQEMKKFNSEKETLLRNMQNTKTLEKASGKLNCSENSI